MTRFDPFILLGNLFHFGLVKRVREEPWSHIVLIILPCCLVATECAPYRYICRGDAIVGRDGSLSGAVEP